MKQKTETVSHIGSLATKTDFKLENGNHVRVAVWFSNDTAQSGTYYNCSISTKGRGCRNWHFQFNSKTSLDERIFDFISEEQLYTSYFNHYTKLNPIRMFRRSEVNGEYGNFSVEEKKQPTKHYAF